LSRGFGEDKAARQDNFCTSSRYPPVDGAVGVYDLIVSEAVSSTDIYEGIFVFTQHVFELTHHLFPSSCWELIALSASKCGKEEAGYGCGPNKVGAEEKTHNGEDTLSSSILSVSPSVSRFFVKEEGLNSVCCGGCDVPHPLSPLSECKVWKCFFGAYVKQSGGGLGTNGLFYPLKIPPFIRWIVFARFAFGKRFQERGFSQDTLIVKILHIEDEQGCLRVKKLELL
jgi:hypothetical protein